MNSAVIFLSYSYAVHEIRIGELAREAGFSQVSLSHEVMPMTRMVPRGLTTCADAYLTPHIKNYVQVMLSLSLFTSLSPSLSLSLSSK